MTPPEGVYLTDDEVFGTSDDGRRTAAGRPIVDNPDGTVSTERSITVQRPDGVWTNIPTMYAGRQVSEDVAYDTAVRNGWRDPETGRDFGGWETLDQAEAAARERSVALGREVDGGEYLSDDEVFGPAGVGDDPGVGRIRTGVSNLGRGAADVGAGAAKGVGIAAAQGNRQVLDVFDRIDASGLRADRLRLQPESVRLGDVPLVAMGDIEAYERADDAGRAAIRQRYATTDPRETGAYRAGEWISEEVKRALPVNPEHAEEWLATKIPQGFGSAVGFMGLGLATGGGAAGIAALGAASQASQQFEDAIGKGASLEDAFNAANLGAIVGTSEAVPLGRLLDRLDRGTGGSIKKLIVEAIKQGTEEAAQEAFQAISSNLIASDLVGYDPERGTFQGAGENAGVGFSVGALMETIGGLILLHGRRGARTPGNAAPTQQPQPQPQQPEPGQPPAPEEQPAEVPQGAMQGEQVIGAVEEPAAPPKRMAPLTPEDEASPLPNDAISRGKAIMEDAVAGRPLDAAPAAPERPEFTAQAPVETPSAEMPQPAGGPAAEQAGAAPTVPVSADQAPPAAASISTRETAEIRGPQGEITPESAIGISTTPATAETQPDQQVAADQQQASAPADTRIDGAAPERGPFIQRRPRPGEPTAAPQNYQGAQRGPAFAVDAERAAAVDQQAAQIAEPTEAQKEAGNYRKGHTRFAGLDITVETGKGQERSGTDPDGKPWSVTMPAHYGYIRRTEGADGDHVDVYLGDGPETSPVFVIDQVDADTRAFDEHKVIMGVPSRLAAESLYMQAFSDGRGRARLGAVRQMSMDEFKAWLRDGDQKRPAAEQPDMLGGPTLSEQDLALRDRARAMVEKGLTEQADLETVIEAARDRDPKGLSGAAQDVYYDLIDGRGYDSDAVLEPRLDALRAAFGEVNARPRLRQEPRQQEPQQQADQPAAAAPDFAAGRTAIEQAPTKPAPTIAPYSDKSIIVRGITKAEGETLFAGMKARPLWNAKAEGWVFSKKREAEVRKALSSGPAAGQEAAGQQAAAEPAPTSGMRVMVNKVGRDGLTDAERGGPISLTEPPEWWSELTPAGRSQLARKAGLSAPGTISGMSWQSLARRPEWVGAMEAAARQEERRQIGVNAAGNPVFEDGRGVRSYVEDGVRQTESVRLEPGRGGSVDPARRGSNFKTTEEVAAAPGAPPPAAQSTTPESQKAAADQPGTAPAGTTRARPADYGANNKLVTADRAALARERLRAKLRGQLNTGIDPEIMAEGAILAVYHVEAGTRKFADFAHTIVEELGDTAKPFLRLWYNAARDYPGMASGDMTPYAEVQAADIDAILTTAAADSTAADTSVPATTAGDDRARIAEAFRNAFAGGRRFASIVEARKLASDVLGRPVDASMAKMVEEAIEAGVVMRAREIVRDARSRGRPFAEVFDDLVGLYAAQPLLNTRTSTSVEQQAYSTPAPLAYLASRLANVGPGLTVYEPSAGNGMLLIDATPAKVHANELNPDRFASLRRILGDAAEITNEDGVTFAPPEKVDRVVANPPFGKTKNPDRSTRMFPVEGMMTPEIDHAIAWKALEAMKDDGRAVLIIGGIPGEDAERVKDYRSTRRLAFMKKLYDNFKVTEHFTADGSLYERQGAGWPVDVIVIEGRGKSAKPLPSAVPPRIFRTWADLRGRLDGTVDSLDTRGKPPRRGDRGAREDVTPDEGGVSARPGRSDRPAGVEGSTGAGAAVTGSGRGGRPVDSAATDGDRGAAGGERGDARPDERSEPVPVPGSEQPAEDGSRDREGDRSRDARGVPDRGVSQPGRVERDNQEAETAFQVRYAPTSNARFAVGTLVPRNMQAAMDRALRALSGRVGDIDAYVADKLGYSLEQLLGTEERPGYFSAEQVDALALAIDNIEGGGGFVIGDQTGVGKGRFVAAMLRYALEQNRVPVFMTKDPGLYADMIRDLRDIGMPDIASRILVTNNGLRGEKAIPLSAEDATDTLQSMPDARQKAAIEHIARTGSLPDGYEMLFTTYSQVQYGPQGAEIDRQRAIRSIAPNAIMVLDESHEAGGSEGKKFDAKSGAAVPTRADFVREVLRDAAGAVYSSATYAKNPTVMSLYFKTDLALAVDDLDQLAPTIAAGGVPLQQVMANMLVEAGQYARRERSFEGVEMALDVLPTNGRMAEQASSALRSIFNLDKDFMEEARQNYIDDAEAEGSKGGKDAAIGESSASSTNFASIMHVVVSQMLLSLKARAAVDKAIELHRGGQKPIIALSNTNESIVRDYIEDEGLRPGAAAELTFNAILLRYLRRLRRITLKDDNGNRSHVYLSDDEIREYGGEEALSRYRAVERSLRTIDLSDLPASPVDFILDTLNAAGVRADEITGRQDTLRGGKYTVRKGSTAEKKRAMNDYNSGKLDALVINKSGSTGFSLHATGRKGNDGKKRHMIVLQPDPNIDVFMQMLGRIHRTGQIKLPGYTIAVSDLAVEKRQAAVLMRKMASLNANTTASKKSAVSLDNVTDFMNRYGDEVVADYLRENTEVANMTDVRPSSSGESDGLAARLTGRLAILPPERVSEIYEQIESAYQEYIEALDRMGLNTLEAKTLDLDARTVDEDVLVEAKGDNSPFAEAAVVETVDVRKLGNPYTLDEIKAEIDEALGGRYPRQFMDDLLGKLDAAMPVHVEGLQEGLRNAEAAITEAKSDKQKERAEGRVRSWKEAITEAEARLANLKARVQQYRPGSTHTLRVRDGEAESTVDAVVLSIDTRIKGNPTAASAIRVRFAIADAGREVQVPLSKMMGDAPSYSTAEADPAAVRRAFESGGQEAREKRQMITGNLVAGYSVFKKGQIVMFTDAEGRVRQGILMPKEFDAGKEMEQQPVTFSEPEHATAFLKGGPGVRWVHTSDRVLSIQFDGRTYVLQANVRGGKPYFLNQAVRGLIGDFQQRRGQKTQRAETTDARKVEQAIRIYQENLGSKFVTTSHKDEARAITGQKVFGSSASEGAKYQAAAPAVRTRGIPEAAAAPIATFKTDAEIKAHRDYRAAKGGDVRAAERLVRDMVPARDIAAAARRFGADVLYLPVLAEEAGGRNKIPLAVAARYAMETGADFATNIVQSSRSYHTGARPMERMISRPTFEGRVKPGQRYVLVDDVTVMGGTLAEMADFIQAAGGEVAGVVTLVNAGRSGHLRVPPLRAKLIEGRYGDAIRDELGVDPAALTADEATYILGFRDADGLREAIARARDDRGRRLSAKGLRQDGQGGVAGTERRAAAEAVRSLLGRIAPDADVDMPAIITMRDGRAAYGRVLDGVISIALNAPNALNTARHEAIHWLREAGLIKDADWRALERATQEQGWLERFDIAGRYRDQRLSPEQQIEEAIAEAYAEWATGGRQVQNRVLMAFRALVRFFDQVRAAIRKAFGREADWRDLFAAVESGAVGRSADATPRETGSPFADMLLRRIARYLPAWHGSPHDFDRFSLDKIGTGEGAQAYGWGLYFASRREIGEHYRKQLSRRRADVTIDGVPWTQYASRADVDMEAVSAAVLAEEAGSVAEAIKKLESSPATQRAHPGALEFLQQSADRLTVRPAGRLYEVELSPEPEHLLDWDKPLSEQSEYVRERLDQLDVGERDFDFVGDRMPKGKDAYEALSERLAIEGGLVADADIPGSPRGWGAIGPVMNDKLAADRAASLALLEAGIPGLRYLDGSSRSRGEGAHNYVIFDESAVEVRAKYQAGPPDGDEQLPDDEQLPPVIAPGFYMDRRKDFGDRIAGVGTIDEKIRAADAWTVDRGQQSGGFEHIVVLDADGAVLQAGTNWWVASVQFTPEVNAMADQAGSALVAVHNHPSGTSLSTADLLSLLRPGLARIRAATAAGEFTAEAAPGVRYPARKDTEEAIERIAGMLNDRLVDAWLAGRITDGEADQHFRHGVNVLLHRLGIIKYEAALPDGFVPDAIAEAVDAAMKQARVYARGKFGGLKEQPYAEARRPDPGRAQPLRPEGGLGSLRGPGEQPGPGPRGGEDGQAPDRAASRAPEGDGGEGGEPDIREELGRLTTSTEFRRWFRDSQVIDENGEPLRVYHGTNKAIEAFDGRRPTIWFAANPQLANRFVGGGRRRINDLPRKGSAVYPAYLRIEKSLDLRDYRVNSWVKLPDLLKRAGLPADRTVLEEIGRKDLERHSKLASWIEDPLGTLIAEYNTGSSLFRWLDNPVVIDRLRAAGYDGIIMREDLPGIGKRGARKDPVESVTYAVFSPEQIKSATGNRGTFDPDDPSIVREDPGGFDIPPDARRQAEANVTGAGTEGGAAARQSLMSRLIGAQPLDRVMRLPFDVFGGVDERGEWRAGRWLSRQAERVITEAEFSDSGRMAWLNTTLRKARAGLVDRYGLDPAYVDRDMRRALDERRIQAEVPEIMKALKGGGIGVDEARVLQAVLTGEAVPDAEMAKLSEPIRNAIDHMGQEAVRLGLLSAESYERNRGAYLHRVYLRHETDQNRLVRWVSRLATSQRKKIVGDQFKGRGMWIEASAGSVLRNTEAAETLRRRSGMLRATERRREELVSRLERAMIQADERSAEMVQHLARRFDLAERVAVGKRRLTKETFRKPTDRQKGAAGEQAASLARLRNKSEQAVRLMQKLESQIVEADARIAQIEAKIFADGDLQATDGDRFQVLDRVEGGKVRARVYVPDGAPVPDRYAGFVDKGLWEVRGRKGGKVVLWRDFTKPEREQMGEIVDARYTIAKTYMGMAHDLATGRFYQDIAGNEEWSVAEPPEGEDWRSAEEYNRYWADPDIAWVRVPDTVIAKSSTKRWGALAGRYVRAEIWRDIQEVERMQTPSWWDTLMTVWKLNKTVRSPVVHMNNVLSNVVLMDLADVRAVDLARGIRAMVRKDADYRDAVEAGAFGTDMMSIEIRDEVLKPLLEEIERDMQGGRDAIEAKFGVVGKVLDRIWSTTKRADQAMKDAYRFEDEVFRMATYMRRRSLGYSVEEAARDARDQFLNYDIRAPWVSFARRYFLPFISYTYRAVPVIAKSVAVRPWKLAKYATIAWAADALAYMITGDGDDEDEQRRSLREEEQGTTWFGAPRMIRMPWSDNFGNPVFLDVRRWIPAGDVFDTGQGSSAIPVPAWLQFGGPLMIGAELALNKSGFTGKEIVNEYTDDASDRLSKTGDYLWKAWMPSAAWVPGSWYWSKIGDAVTGVRDWQGRPYSVPQAVASSVGIKVKPQDVAEGFYFHGLEFDRVERELQAQARTLGRDRARGKIGEAEYNRRMSALIEKNRNLADRRRETFEGR